LLPALNEDLTTAQAIALDTHLPALIFLLLICVALFRHDLCGAGFGRAAIGMDPAGPHGSGADRIARLDSIGAQRKINAPVWSSCRLQNRVGTSAAKAALNLLARCRGDKATTTKIPT
jgi:hypothetical protein